jgi:hypothetical protein
MITIRICAAARRLVNLLTNDKIGIKFAGNGHDDLLKGIHVVPITHAL